jgi:transcriptional regulator with XRE-family HTH domain
MRELARDPKQIGNLIRGERKRKAMSQKELASRAGLRQASVSAIENGSPTTKLQTLLADHRKFQACLERGIELMIVDSSKLTYTKEKTMRPCWEMIWPIINAKNQIDTIFSLNQA